MLGSSIRSSHVALRTRTISRRHGGAIARACAEMLEPRQLLSTVTVTSVDDTVAEDGVVTLREAILSVNTNADVNADVTANRVGDYLGTVGSDVDAIHFNIPGAGAQMISLADALPSLTERVTIDATTQPTFAGTPLIILDGSLAGSVDGGLAIFAPSTTIRGFKIQNFEADSAVFDTGAGIYVLNFEDFGGPVVLAGNVVVANAVGIFVSSPTGFVIGGITAADRNVVSGNDHIGIAVNSDFTGQSRIQGNYIGVDVDGVTPLPNGGDGIRNTGAGASGTLVDGTFLVGGSFPEAGNVIAFNAGNGVTFSVGAVVRLNSIHSNGLLGIDNIGSNGNDPGDTDIKTFSNPDLVISTLQNHPVLSGATRSGGNLTVSGVLNSNPNSPLLLDFYASVAPDAFAGEGQTYIGSITVITDSFGNATFSPTFAAAAGAGDYITATATSIVDGYKSETSEFSPAVTTVLAPKPAPVVVGYNDLKASRQKNKLVFTGVVASFTSDAFNSASDFAANINWGDGTSSAGQIVYNSSTNQWDVIGTHQYAKRGKYSLLITITDAGGKTATATSQLVA